MISKPGPLHTKMQGQLKSYERKDMSKATEQNTEARAGRVQVGKLPQQEKDLRDREAEKVKGGGGLSGGVVLPPGGEEIPQRNRN